MWKAFLAALSGVFSGPVFKLVAATLLAEIAQGAVQLKPELIALLETYPLAQKLATLRQYLPQNYWLNLILNALIDYLVKAILVAQPVVVEQFGKDFDALLQKLLPRA